MPPDEPCKPTTQTLAQEHLEPIRAFVHAQHGLLAKLTTEMQSRTSTPITRQAVSRWLHLDPAKRQQPTMGVFLVMQAAVQKIQAEQSAVSAAS